MLSFKSVNIITAIVFIGLVSSNIIWGTSIMYILFLCIIWLGLTASGSLFIRWNYHLKSLHSNPNVSNNQIAITFDDGPHPVYTPRVLQLLKQHNAKATFFCIGKHIETHPELAKCIIAEGHTIGNHTYSHSNSFGFFKTTEVVSELERTNKICKALLKLNLRLYRPAFGVTNPRIKRAIKTVGLQSVGWNKRSLDTTSLSKARVFKRVSENLKKGDVILLHDTSEKSVDVLEQLLLHLDQQNLESVTVDSLFNIKAYA